MQAGLLLQGTGFGSARQTKDFNMKDHMTENVRRMRQIQRKCKQKELEAVKPVKVMWKSDKYTDVQSKVKQDLENPAPSSRPLSATFLRAHSRSGPPMRLDSCPGTPDTVSTHKLSVPLASDANDVKMVRHDFDFIKVNGRNAKHCKTQRPASASALTELKEKNEKAMSSHCRGEVPVYLQNRKKQWKKEEEDRIASIPDPAMPSGHRSLPEQERLDTLALLKNKEKELVRELGALPIGVDTIRVHNKRKELEGKLAELEEAIRIFSRPKVFVKVDV